MIIDKIKRLLRSGYRQIKKFWQIGFVVTLALCISFLCSFAFKSYAKYSSSINVTVSATAGALGMDCTVETTTDLENNYPYFVITVTNVDDDLYESDVDVKYTLTISQSDSDSNYTAVSGMLLSYKDGYGNGNGSTSEDGFTYTSIEYEDTIDIDNLDSNVKNSSGYYENKINIYVYYLIDTATDVNFDVYLDAYQVTDTSAYS